MTLVALFTLAYMAFGCEHASINPEGDLSFSLSPSEVLELEEDWVGETITVEGKVMPGNLICTLIGCLEDNPCCNECSGTLDLLDTSNEYVSDGIVIRAGDGVEGSFECTGNECEQTCDPLTNNETYEVTGTLEMDDEGTYFISVESFENVIE
jgi:hypothetical protein